ncbi:hypothetical protein MHO82_23270 [Vibrio sp. Of7-15]|uniref:hypothetical protein n=1 Tax=Vibrio sp. Of7-15 TaxID=2724879 RepID=UPI001EF2AF09|nr:hypothetical protein [Vibrio sp. Of7-15]MCG7499792.1 hypothetical protein [Vibrio sp. Of7-15]
MNMFKYVCPKCNKLRVLSESEIKTMAEYRVITCKCGEDLQLCGESEQLTLIREENKENDFWKIKQVVVYSLAFLLCVMFIFVYNLGLVSILVAYTAGQVLKRPYNEESIDLELEALSDMGS